MEDLFRDGALLPAEPDQGAGRQRERLRLLRAPGLPGAGEQLWLHEDQQHPGVRLQHAL